MNTENPLHVVFGTGPLGMSVVRELVRRGQRVRVINRSGSAAVPAGVEVTRADAYEHAQTVDITRGAAVVYQCAQPGYAEWAQKFPPLQTSILNAAAANGAKLIVGENLYMYGRVHGSIHEALPFNATNRKGTVRAKMAQELIDAHKAGKVRMATARGSDFYGPLVLGSGMGEVTFGRILAGKSAQIIGDPDQPHSYTHIDDFGRTLVTLGARDDALGQAWHVPNAPAISTRAMLEMIAAEAGQTLKIQKAGALMLTVVGLFVPDLREMKEMLYEFEEPFVVDDTRARSILGLDATALADGVKETVAWYRQHTV